MSQAAAHVLDDPIELQRFTRMAEDAARPVAESSFQLSGLHCAACAGTIEAALAQVDGVVEATVNTSAARASVRWDPQRTRPSALVDAIQAAGYDAVPDTAAQARVLRRAESRQLLWRLFVAAFCAMQVMMMATPSYVAGAGELAPDIAALLNRASWLLTLPVLFFSAAPFFRGAWHAVKQRRIGMDVPVALGIAVCFVASSGAAFSPGGVFGREVYFDSLTMFISFLLGGRFLEMKARHRAAESLERALASMPQTARRLGSGGQVELVSVQRLAVGDEVLVAHGDVVPADGHLTERGTEFDESLLTGESRPVARKPGDEVVAGAVNLGDPVVVSVKRVGADTRYEGIVALMREAATQRPASTRTADRWAGPFLWGVILLAGGAAIAWHTIDPNRAIWVAVSVLIVTCPCALSLATPAALLASASTLARRGVLLRRIDALETLAHVQTVYFDKTGTLTRGQPVLVEALSLIEEPADGPRWIDVAAALARQSTHPVSRALVAAANPIGPSITWRQLHEQGGRGIEALDAQGVCWQLGAPGWVTATDETQAEGLTTLLSRNGVPVLQLRFAEAPRPDAPELIHALRAQGIETRLLSGDTPKQVQALADRLQLDGFAAAATPESKLAAVRDAQVAGRCVAMVGDGVNDAPVLAQADVSIAMGEGAAVAQLQADVIVTGGQLASVQFARTQALRTVRVMRQNLAWALAYNLSCVPLALMGWLPPWAAGLGMAMSSLFVVMNSLRLTRA
jgi:Cu2+-exporting ATPase